MADEDLYHKDFTTASGLEVFLARVEEIIHDWELPRTSSDHLIAAGNFNNANWLTQSETLTLIDTGSLWEKGKYRLDRFDVLASPCRDLRMHHMIAIVIGSVLSDRSKLD